MAERPRAVVLDFDGVVVDSVDIKTNAFESVFSDEDPSLVALILDYHRAHNGISRHEKFGWAYREVLRRPLTPEAAAGLGVRYNKLVEDAVVAALWIPGAREFIALRPAPLFVASGTPEEELRRIVARRGLEGSFDGVYGTPALKAAILERVARETGVPASALVMVGDAMTDHDAAMTVGARFIGVVGPGLTGQFPPGTELIPDLTRLASALAFPAEGK